jgi:hypothetical protein
VIKDLVKIVGLFGGAQMTFIGLLPADLPDDEFAARSQALRDRVEDVEFDAIECVDVDARDAADCLFGAEARQMAGESHDAAFILRAHV